MGTEEILISRKELARLKHDPEKSAEAVDLLYITDDEEGISRKKRGRGFAYFYKGEKVSDKDTIERINRLVIPPAWQKVWICTEPNGHMQVTGYDAKNRKQYIYHPLWIALRSQTKFSHMYEFGKSLPDVRDRLAKALNKRGLPLEKVLAIVVAVMQHTHIRIGNSAYEKENGSYGLTTLKDGHVDINSTKAKFSFKGKKGVYQQITLKNRRLARMVQQCKDIPGKELFQYYDEDGKHYAVDSGMVNEYIREISGKNFTAKDFRTWFGSLRALQKLKEIGCCDNDKERKKKVIDAIDTVAEYLGNTRAVCRKYYIHPSIIDFYNENKLDKFFGGEHDDTIPHQGLSSDEESMMKILKMQTRIAIAEL